ncbi:MAG: glycosyltransferase family 4 protein [Elusimicrobiota bacterium]|jgi:glycosyltransferase involved in cell wall biosynthesis|nr:glycosyltransferase family 4 protein [Elusimicrobiota bacterium]
MKILFLTDNFPPEVNAPATRTFEHALEWVKEGAEVTIITCFPNFPQGKIYTGYKNSLYKNEFLDGIRVLRVYSYMSANEGIFKRILDYISFSFAAFIAGLFQKTDLIIATSPQFFTALSARALSFWKKKPWIMEVRDLWPESIKSVNIMNNDSLFFNFLKWEEKKCYNLAKKIIVVTDSFKKILIERNIDESKIEVVKNGVDRSFYISIPKNIELIEKLKLKGKFIIGYIGTLGLAHNLEFILRCAKNIEKKTTYYHFLFIGDGAQKKNLIKLCEQLNLTNVTFLNSIPKCEIRKYISILDVALVNLKKTELFKTVIPSKIFENASMQIPILLGVDGEAREIVESYGAGLYFEPESADDFYEKLCLLSNKSVYDKLRKGCLNLSVDFDRKFLAHKMYDILEKTIIKS